MYLYYIYILEEACTRYNDNRSVYETRGEYINLHGEGSDKNIDPLSLCRIYRSHLSLFYFCTSVFSTNERLDDFAGGVSRPLNHHLLCAPTRINIYTHTAHIHTSTRIIAGPCGPPSLVRIASGETTDEGAAAAPQVYIIIVVLYRILMYCMRVCKGEERKIKQNDKNPDAETCARGRSVVDRVFFFFCSRSFSRRVGGALRTVGSVPRRRGLYNSRTVVRSRIRVRTPARGFYVRITLYRIESSIHAHADICILSS